MNTRFERTEKTASCKCFQTYLSLPYISWRQLARSATACYSGLKSLRNRCISVRLNSRISLTGPLALFHSDSFACESELIYSFTFRSVTAFSFGLCYQGCQFLLFFVQFPQSLDFFFPQKEHIDQILLRSLADERQLVYEFWTNLPSVN